MLPKPILAFVLVGLLSLEQQCSADATASPAAAAAAQDPVLGSAFGWPTLSKILSSKHGTDGAICSAGICTSQDLLSDATATLISPSRSGSQVCSSVGRYADINDCGQYYDCIRGNDGKLIAKKRSCYGNAFDASTQTCVSPHMVNGCSNLQLGIIRSNTIEYPDLQKLCSNFKNGYICGDCHTLVLCVQGAGFPMPCEYGSACSMAKEGFSGGVCHPDISDACNCTAQDSLKIDLYDPTKFLSCSGGETVVKSCPDGSIFNNDTQNCEALSSLSCSTSGQGMFTASNDCSKYISCSYSTNGWSQRWFTCPINQMFNEDMRICQEPCQWQYGNFTCKAEGRFPNLIDCSSYYECFENPMNKGKFIQVVSLCPDGFEWVQDEGQCMARGTSKNKCKELSPKPSSCSIPTEKCLNKALAACVEEHEFCECQDDVYPITCNPCPPGHVSNETGCFPLCSILQCGDNEICSDENGKVPGTCTCAQGFIFDGENCKALCSNMACGENEICTDEDGQVPGSCICAQGYAQEEGECKDICLSADGVYIGNQCLTFNTNSLTFFGAMMACAAKGQQLAILADTNITALDEYMSKKNYISWHHVGGSDEGTEGKWFWIDGRPLGEGVNKSPDQGGTSQNCLEYHPGNLGFYPDPCTDTIPSICSLDVTKPPHSSEDSKNALVRLETSSKQCPEDTFNVYNECFFIPNDNFKTWSNAQAFCRSKGGFLAEPDSIVNFLQVLADIRYGYNYWIGTATLEDEQNWSWNSNKEKMDDSVQWPAVGGVEDKGCQLVMRGEQLPLYKANCNDYHLFVCERSK